MPDIHTGGAAGAAPPPSEPPRADVRASGDQSSSHAARTASGIGLALDRGDGYRLGDERELDELDRLAASARRSAAYEQLRAGFPAGTRITGWLSRRALAQLAGEEPVDPGDPYTWASERSHQLAMLARHGLTNVDPRDLSSAARARLVAEGAAPPDLDDPASWLLPSDQRAALARRLGLDPGRREDLSRFALEHPERFDQGELRCWQIGSDTWLELAAEQLGPVDHVRHPVGVFLAPAGRQPGSWVLFPALSVELIRLVWALGGSVERELSAAMVPKERVAEFLERVPGQALHAGPREALDSARRLGQELSAALGATVYPGLPSDGPHRWGRLLVSRSVWNGVLGDLRLQARTVPIRGYQSRRLGSLPLPAAGSSRWLAERSPSAAMELGEAVATAAERELPVLLSSEAAGELSDTVRVGRMKGRPGVLTITRAHGPSAVTERHVAEQTIAVLRVLKRDGADVVLDAGARQLVRMSTARPLADDPVLKPPQQRIAALKVVGSGVDASATATGKTVTTARALAHRATAPGFRAMIVAEGRLIGQWQRELTAGDPGRGLPPLAPNVAVETLDERSRVIGQVRGFHRRLGNGPGVLLVANSILERYTADLCAVHWHLVVADEGHRYCNPATEAHRALRQLRFEAALDCWILTATPKGKSAENIDVLVGLALADEALIRERLNTREAGDLTDEVSAARYRVHYGPHFVRVTKKEMAPYMPTVLPAKPLAIEPDEPLRELLEEIRSGGRAAYRAMLAAVKQLQAVPRNSEVYKAALARLASAQGMVLGNVGVFLDASVDPETLTRSDSALAKSLVRSGLVERAISGGGPGVPLLRGIVAETLARVAREQQALVFAERVWCLRQLARTVRDLHGIDARAADGSTPPDEFAELKRAFCAGEFPVLCLSKVGQEGHNLQVAGVIVNLDLPWTPDPIEQRVGRAQRIGSPHGYIETYLPYVKGGGIEHVVKVVAPRGAEHHQILDAPGGVSAEESTIASQLAAITAEVAESRAALGWAATAARLRVAAAVFGA